MKRVWWFILSLVMLAGAAAGCTISDGPKEGEGVSKGTDTAALEEPYQGEQNVLDKIEKAIQEKLSELKD